STSAMPCRFGIASAQARSSSTRSRRRSVCCCGSGWHDRSFAIRVTRKLPVVLRTNLSTRPFYNERIIHLLIVLAGVIILGISLFNVVKVIDLSRQNTDLSRRISRDRDEGDRRKREAAQIRKGIDPKELGVVAAAAHEANTLIDQRTFSWTQFFNH